MATMITLDDDLVAGLENKAKELQLSVEQFAISLLTEAIESESDTPLEVVARIRAAPPNPSQIRPATANLADVLYRVHDPTFRSLPPFHFG